ncbi:hypothetical protein ACS0TY_002941 [Phlomoides rotata]
MLAYPIRAMGVEKDLLKAGTGPKPVAGQNVTVHCTGFGKNGDLTKKFWSTKDPGQKPFSFQIGKGNVIKAIYLSVGFLHLDCIAQVAQSIGFCSGIRSSIFAVSY